MLTGTTRAKVCGSKISPERMMTTIYLKVTDSKLILSITSLFLSSLITASCCNDMINDAFSNMFGYSIATVLSISLKSMMSQNPTLINEFSTVDEKCKRPMGYILNTELINADLTHTQKLV